MAPADDVELPDGDPVRKYSPEEERGLTERLLELTRRVHAGEETFEAPTIGLLLDLHRRLFTGIRGHAGKARGPGFGSERLAFGPNRSAHRDAVPGELEQVFESVRRSLRSFDANRGAERFEADAVHLAVWAHAQIIRIHPFEDGNGRTSRLIMNGLLVRLGLRPIALEACKPEYTDALNLYFHERNFRPLLDLFLRLAKP